MYFLPAAQSFLGIAYHRLLKNERFALGSAAMSDNYGATFAQKLLQRGEYEEAIVAADKHAQQDPDSPEPYYDRARARAELKQYEAAFADYARAIELDREEQVLQDWEVDDGLFSMLIAWAQSLGQSATVQATQVAIMERYKQVLPSGQHLQDAADWTLRFRGLLKSTFVKPQ